MTDEEFQARLLESFLSLSEAIDSNDDFDTKEDSDADAMPQSMRINKSTPPSLGRAGQIPSVPGSESMDGQSGGVPTPESLMSPGAASETSSAMSNEDFQSHLVQSFLVHEGDIQAQPEVVDSLESEPQMVNEMSEVWNKKHHDVLMKHGWTDEGLGSYEHPYDPHHNITVHANGDWDHEKFVRGGEAIHNVADGSGHESLDKHLTKFHKRK